MSDNTDPLKHLGNICISGLTAAGKTTHSLLLAGEFGLTFVSGSQVRLFQSGVFPIQQKDFWLSEEGKALWREDTFRKVEPELFRLESVATGYIFDTFTMPWLHKTPALCIWLASDIESRAIKSFISHRGMNHFPVDSYAERIAEKDSTTIGLYKTLYNIDIGTTFDCFDLVFDISSFIKAATLEASLSSIARAHRLIRAASGYYLTRSAVFEAEFRDATRDNQQFILRNNVL